VKTATNSNVASSAGISRRARRPQNDPTAMRSARRHSAISSEVIRKPEMTKKRSTPRNAPRAHP